MADKPVITVAVPTPVIGHGIYVSVTPEGVIAQPETILFPAEGSLKHVDVITDVPVTYEIASADWASLEVTPDGVNIKVTANTTEAERTAELTIKKAGDEEDEGVKVTLKQTNIACGSLSITPSLLSVAAAGVTTEAGTVKVDVQAENAWDLYCDSPWIHVEKDKYHGFTSVKEIKVAVDKNDENYVRVGKIVVRSGKDQVEAIVEQAALTI